MWALIAAALAAAAKGYEQYKQGQEEDRQSRLDSVKAATMPWLHIQPKDSAHTANVLSGIVGGAAQGGLAGSAFDQSLARNDIENQLLQQKLKSGNTSGVNINLGNGGQPLAPYSNDIYSSWLGLRS